MEQIVLICEDCVEGILTGIYEAYARKISHEHTRVQIKEDDTFKLFTTYYHIPVDTNKATKVLKTLNERFSEETYKLIWLVLASCEEEMPNDIYHLIVYGLENKCRRNLFDIITNPYIERCFRYSRAVWNEVHHFKGFLRFKELKSGVLFAKIAPKNRILISLAPHFSNRLPLENFIIFDEIRMEYVVHEKGTQFFMVSGEIFEKDKCLEFSKEELEIQILFKEFCDKISIKERENLQLQRNLLPIRFRSNMVEF
ncbi:MAG: TIGR03915 family putative DNA repair protein [Lachnospiraceae bacterium]